MKSDGASNQEEADDDEAFREGYWNRFAETPAAAKSIDGELVAKRKDFEPKAASDADKPTEEIVEPTVELNDEKLVGDSHEVSEDHGAVSTEKPSSGVIEEGEKPSSDAVVVKDEAEPAKDPPPEMTQPSEKLNEDGIGSLPQDPIPGEGETISKKSKSKRKRKGKASGEDGKTTGLKKKHKKKKHKKKKSKKKLAGEDSDQDADGVIVRGDIVDVEETSPVIIEEAANDKLAESKEPPAAESTQPTVISAELPSDKTPVLKDKTRKSKRKKKKKKKSKPSEDSEKPGEEIPKRSSDAESKQPSDVLAEETAVKQKKRKRKERKHNRKKSKKSRKESKKPVVEGILKPSSDAVEVVDRSQESKEPPLEETIQTAVVLGEDSQPNLDREETERKRKRERKQRRLKKKAAKAAKKDGSDKNLQKEGGKHSSKSGKKKNRKKNRPKSSKDNDSLKISNPEEIATAIDSVARKNEDQPNPAEVEEKKSGFVFDEVRHTPKGAEFDRFSTSFVID